METAALRVGEILIDNETKKRFRVIFIRDAQIILCQMDCSQVRIVEQDTTLIMHLLESAQMSIAKEEKKVIKTDCLATAVREKYEAYLAIIEKVNKVYGPDYLSLGNRKHKEDFDAIIQESGLSRVAMWKIIRRYLQSGFDSTSLIDKRTYTSHKPATYEAKTGRKNLNGYAMGVIVDDNIKKHFTEALNYYKSGRAKTYEDAYDMLCMTHYSTMETTEDSLPKRYLHTSGLMNL